MTAPAYKPRHLVHRPLWRRVLGSDLWHKRCLCRCQRWWSDRCGPCWCGRGGTSVAPPFAGVQGIHLLDDVSAPPDVLPPSAAIRPIDRTARAYHVMPCFSCGGPGVIGDRTCPSCLGRGYREWTR